MDHLVERSVRPSRRSLYRVVRSDNM